MKSKLFFTFLALVVYTSQAQGQSASWSGIASQGYTDRYELTTSAVNGKIFAIGGGVPFSNLVQVYDPATDSWATPQVQGQFITHYGAAASVINGKIYIFGGTEDNIDYADSVWVFDPANNTWSTPNLLEGSNSYTTRSEPASAVIGDSVFLIGGSQGFGDWINTVEVYHTKTNEWTTLNAEDSLNAVWTPSASVVNGKIYVIGAPVDSSCHCEVQVYDPQTNKWSIEPANPMNVLRTYFATVVVNNKIYAIGGNVWTYGGTTTLSTNTTDVYDPSTHHWDTLLTENHSLYMTRGQLAASAIDNKIYVIGGYQTNVNNVVLTLPQSNVENANGEIYYNHRVYPIPATNWLNLVSVEASSHFNIVDMLGRTVISGMTPDHGTLTLNLTNLSNGVYFVRVERADMKGIYVDAGKVIIMGK